MVRYKFSKFQTELVRQLVAEAMIQRLTGQETLDYIKTRMKEDITIDYVNKMKRAIRDKSITRLNHLRKRRMDYIDELFFKRKDELDKYTKELWRLFYANEHDSHLQKDLLHEMRDITVILRDMYDMLPAISGLSFLTEPGVYNGEKTISEALGSEQELQPVV